MQGFRIVGCHLNYESGCCSAKVSGLGSRVSGLRGKL